MSESTKAVFLSYASQDSEAAKRICEALRAAGVEVWFDQSELVGGDAWDQKIRRQIKDCALLIPIISANTNARAEGYFRLEWRLADQRTHLMGRNRAFLLPVTIDGTSDADADVPDAFTAVQWTKAPGGEVPPAFVARVQKLLAGESNPGSRGPAAEGQVGQRPPAPVNRSRRPGWLVPAILGAVTLAGVAGWLTLRPTPMATPSSGPGPAATKPAANRALVAKAWALMNKADLSRSDWELADTYCRQATEQDLNDADAWAAWSQADSWASYHNFDRSAARRESARTRAARALQLAPKGFESRLAHACQLVRGAGQDKVSNFETEAERVLRALLQEQPDEPRALLALGILQRNFHQVAGYQDTFGRLASNPAFATLAWNELGWAEFLNGNREAADVAIERSIALQPYWGNLMLKLILAARWRGDLDEAKAALERIPLTSLQEDNSVTVALELDFWRREPETMLALLAVIPRDWMASNSFDGPTAFWSGLAYRLAGRQAAADLQWRTALAVVEGRLAQQPNSARLVYWKGMCLALLGKRAESAPLLALARDMGYPGERATGPIALGDTEAAMSELEAAVEVRPTTITAAELRLNPMLDPLRSMPRFQALLARLESDPLFSPKPKPAALVASAPAPVADDKSVAVLAFANLSDDKGNEYFSDGISEELLNVLAKVPGLKVTARTSSFFFKGKEVPVPEIAKQLGVAYVIEGSVRKAGDKVRITAQLIKAADGFHVWSDTFTRDLKDVFAVQDEIAGLIAQQLQLKLGGTSRANQLVNPEAYDLYLRARALSRLEDENYLPIIKLYEAAVAKDPDFALAYVQLSLAHASEYWAGGLDSKPASRAALQAAQRLAPDAPETRLAAGSYAYSCENDWNLARTEFLAAEAGLPGDAQVAFFLGMVQRRLLNFEESIRQVARAIELDPADRNNFAQQAHTFKALRRYPELVDLMAAALKRFPADENFLQTQAIARCEIERDQAAYLRRLRELPAVEARARALKDYALALHAGEWEAAGRILAGANLGYLAITPATTRDPIAMQQALLAHVQGRPEEARRFGAEALAFYETAHWSLRQDKWMKLSKALALAYAGRGAEAVVLARETLAATALRDPWDTVILHTYVASVYLVAGDRDQAFAELRIMMTGPCLQGAEELRRDPLWRTVKDDPRFEEILRSAKRL